MNLADYHCDLFELRIRFGAGRLLSAPLAQLAQLRGKEPTKDSDGDTTLNMDLGCRVGESAAHGHFSLLHRKNDSGYLTVSFHPEPSSTVDGVAPYIEDCGQWLGPLFTPEPMPIHLHANFVFDDSFNSVINLPFPLTTSEKALAGASVTGLAVVMPTDASKTAVIQLGDDETYLFLRWREEIVMAEFNLLSKLSELQRDILLFFRKRTEKDESGAN